ncbi:MAG: Fe-S cluster assembly protein SufD [Chloroflexales bacterium]|nr:Fe-S cluster assembly protein SufD [Chloroflexales bacterium]
MLANNDLPTGKADLLGLPALSALNADALAAHAQASGEPQWLQQRRANALAAYEAAALPRWSRTDLAQLQLDAVIPASDASATAVQWDPTLSQQGVIFTTLKAALRSHAELIERYLGRAVSPIANKFNALHAALWQDGALLYVPKNVAVEEPLRVVYTLSGSNTLIAPHTLIILERGASVTLVEEFTSPDGLTNPVAFPATEAFIGESAQLRLCSVQQWGEGVRHIGAQRVAFEKDGGCEWVSIALGGQLQHIDAEATLGANGARVNWLGVTFASKHQHLVIAPWLRHAANSTDGFMQFKTVVSDHGYSVFDGMVRIEADTHGTVSRLEEHAVHLSQESRNDSIPGLMIDSNDIARAGHASTSGKIDDEQIFYLQARGIPRAEATRIIVMGFLMPVIEAVPVEDLRERLIAAVEEKI